MFRAVKLSSNVFSLNYAFKNPLLIPFLSEGEEVKCFPGIKQMITGLVLSEWLDFLDRAGIR